MMVESTIFDETESEIVNNFYDLVKAEGEVIHQVHSNTFYFTRLTLLVTLDGYLMLKLMGIPTTILKMSAYEESFFSQPR